MLSALQLVVGGSGFQPR